MSLHDDGWAAAPFWLECGDESITFDSLLERCEVVTVGIDGGGLDDLLGLAVVGRETATKKWLHWGHAWVHEIVLKRHQGIAPRLQDFAAAGELTFTQVPGKDLDELIKYINCARTAGKLAAKHCVGVDAAGMPTLKKALQAHGYKVDEQIVGISQGWKLHAIIKALERMVHGKELLHAAQALMAWSIGNAKVVLVGSAVTINKQVSGTAKIDPLMAMFNASSLMALNPEAARKEYAIYHI